MVEDRTNKLDLVVTRIIEAPIELVWKAWTIPEYIMQWWGPQFYTSPSCKIDLRVGGKYLFCMRAPQNQGGKDSYTTGIFKSIVPLQKLELTLCPSDKNGNIIDPSDAGMPADFPKEMLMSIVFKAKGAMTEITATQYDWTAGQMYVYALAGLQQSIDKLAQSLAKN